MAKLSVAAVAIGRNEGERLLRCLASLKDRVDRIVYVDSGSTDGSVMAAQAAGAEIVELETDVQFTPSRARNAGFFHLCETGNVPDLVQFIDADCELQPDWIETASGFIEAHPNVAAVSGRRRERHPEATIWNRAIDADWAAPSGESDACGGDVLLRRAALEAVRGYNPPLFVGEEAEMCIRMRRNGWRIWRLPDEMTLHDVNMTKLSQWWNRTRRVGYGYGQAVELYGAPPERHKVSESRRALFWGLALPATALILGVAVSPWALWLLLAWPLQALRLAVKGETLFRSAFLVAGKVPEVFGLLEFWIKRRLFGSAKRIDYK